MNQQQTTIRRRAGVVIAGMLGLVGIGASIAAAPVAIAQADVTPGRVAGINRFDTAAKIAAAAYPSGATSVLLANGRTFPDALAGSALGGAKNAPLLLTETATTPTETTTALQSLKPTTVYLLGGTNAISQAQQDELAKSYTVTRVAGADRYATAGAIADQIGLTNVANLNGKRTAFIATGLNFADALAGGPLAASGAGAAGVHPVLLVNNDVPAATDSALTRLAIQQVVVLGGTSAVSDAVADKLAAKVGSAVIRYAGTNRYDTAAKVAQAGLNSYGLIASEVLLASGADFADALAAGPFGFKRTAPLVLTQPASLPPQTAAFLEDNSSAIQKVTAVGGTSAVSAFALTEAEKAAETPSNDRQNEGIQVSPQAADSIANSGSRSFVANGITASTVDIVLVPCNNVSNDNGSTKFANSNGGSVADKTNRPGATPPAVAPDDADAGNVRISSVNGNPTSEAPHRNEYANNVAPVNGVVSFDIAGPGATDTTSITCVVPVVFQDSNGDDALNVNAGNPASPTERFGTGGRTTFGPTAAGSGDFSVNVTSVDTSANTFTGCTLSTPTDTVPEVSNNNACSSYAWDGTDTYQTGETPNTATSSMAGLEANLSVGDDVVGTYAPSGDSTFRLVDESPLAPTGVTATQTSAPGATATVTVTFTASTTSVTPLKDSTLVHNVYRLTLVPPTGTCPAFSAGAYTKLNSTSVTSPYRDVGIVSGVTYCYVVTAAVNGASATRGETAAAPVKVPVAAT